MRLVFAILLLLGGHIVDVSAQPPTSIPATPPELAPSGQAQQPFFPPMSGPEPYGQLFDQQVLPAPPVVVTEPTGERQWCESPYRNSAWRVEFDLVPTIPRVSDVAFGEWDDDGSLAVRLSLGYEAVGEDGFRLQFWGIDHDTHVSATDVELQASTFYFDFYKRFFVEGAEIVIGAGPATAHLEYDMDALGERAKFKGGGLTAFGETYYPIAHFKKTDIGTVARARVAVLSGRWNDQGTPFVGDTDNDMMTIFELAWGFELRRRFGQHEDQYWYIGLVPEIQRWDSSSLSDLADPGFDGTSINFGLAW